MYRLATNPALASFLLLSFPFKSYAQVYRPYYSGWWWPGRIAGIVIAILAIVFLFLACGLMERRRRRLTRTGAKPNLFGTSGQPSTIPFWQGTQQYAPPPGAPPPGAGGWYYQGQSNVQGGGGGPGQQAAGHMPPPPQAYMKDGKQEQGQGQQQQQQQQQSPQYSPPSGPSPPPAAHTKDSSQFVGGFRNEA